MDRQEYLNQISAGVKPPKPRVRSLFSSKFFWIVIACVLFMAIILIAGNLATSNRVTVEDRVVELLLHVDNTYDIIDEYQSDLKSSTLRGYSASLSGILGGTSGQLTTYATEKYGYKPKSVDKEVQSAADQAHQELNDELFSAKINGELDNFFALKMVYEISTILTPEQAILNTTKNEDLTNILTSSHESLTNLYNNFDGYQAGM